MAGKEFLGASRPEDSLVGATAVAPALLNKSVELRKIVPIPDTETMKSLVQSLLVSLTLLLGLRPAPAALLGQLTTITNFTGTASETWEVFTNGPIADLTPIMGGAATITIAQNAGIYQPGVVEYSLGNVGNAEVGDGVKGFFANQGSSGVLALNGTAFTEFGAYWGANLGTGTNVTITIAGTDINNDDYINTFTYTGMGGNLIWQGWTSPVPLVSVTFLSDATDNGIVVDGLQANFVAVPEPGTVALLGIGVIALIAGRQLRTARRN